LSPYKSTLYTDYVQTIPKGHGSKVIVYLYWSLTLSSVISINSAVINNKPVDYILISRRCVFRAGTRFNVRGVDSEGQVANFVETEQIIIYNGTACSFVQVSLLF